MLDDHLGGATTSRLACVGRVWYVGLLKTAVGRGGGLRITSREKTSADEDYRRTEEWKECTYLVEPRLWTARSALDGRPLSTTAAEHCISINKHYSLQDTIA